MSEIRSEVKPAEEDINLHSLLKESCVASEHAEVVLPGVWGVVDG
jgi:hypothetical protein